MSIMDEVKAQIEKLDENAIRARLARIEEARSKQKTRMQERMKNLTPEQKAKRREKQEAYRERNADRFLAKRKEYNSRPEVKAKRQAYMKKRNAERKVLLARAKELGITA